MGRDTVPPTPYIVVLCDLKRFKEQVLNETTRLVRIDKMHSVHAVRIVNMGVASPYRTHGQQCFR
jgi:hypothetical protein